MRLGCCGSLDQAKALRDAGFDFLEVNVQTVLRGDEPSSQWDATAPDPARFALPVEAANCLMPRHHIIVGPQRDLRALQDYIQRVAKRAGHLGIKRLVFGCASARRRPEGVPAHTAFDHIAEFARMVGEVCAHYDIVMVIEHLHADETNTINKLADARRLCDRVGHPAMAVLVDSYHFTMQHERDEAILDLGDRIRHVHVSEPVGRVQPGAHGRPGDSAEAFDFGNFFSVLRKAGYRERVSVESSWQGEFAVAAPACVQYLRRAWDRAGECDE